MKNNWKKYLLTTSAFCMAFVMCGTASMAASISTSTTVLEKTYSITEPYEYTADINSAEWKSLETIEEQRAAFSVPQEVIDNMSTDALLETVMTNPYFSSLYAFDSLDVGIEVVSTYVDGLEELLKRSDFAEAVASNNEQAAVMVASESEYDIKRALRCELMNDIYLETTGLVVINGVLPLSTNENPIYTPNGSPVSYQYGLTFADHRLNMTTAKQEYKDLIAPYPNIDVIRELSSATAAYNCHSYAWYSTSSTNKYWIEDPQIYFNDGSYTSSTAVAGAKVYWSSGGSPVHSGIIYTAPSSGKVAVVTSKWGPFALIRHDINYSPFGGNTSVYNR